MYNRESFGNYISSLLSCNVGNIKSDILVMKITYLKLIAMYLICIYFNVLIARDDKSHVFG